MRGLRGTRWRLWLALLATLVLTSCVEASADTTPPSVPTGLTASPVSCSQINLAWNASTDTGGSGLWAYNVYVYRNGTWTFLKQVLAPTRSSSVTGLSASTLYYYAIAGVDGAGNTSALSSYTSAATVACTATTTTTTLPAGGACSSPTIIPSQGGTFSGVNSGTSTLAGMCGSTGTSPEKVFRWTPAVSGVATIHTCGGGTNFDTALYMRSGSCSSGGEVACNDDACANASGLLRASRITPTVTAGQTYYIVVDGYGGSQGTFALTVTAPGTVTSTTAIASTSTTTTLVSVDRTVPAMPTGLTAAPASCSQINLSWLASTDTGGSGLKGYNIYRNGVYLKQVLVPATSSSDSGVGASTVYSYAVKAVDNAGNASAMSATTSTNTPGCPVSGGPWVKGFGGTGSDVGEAVATDGSGNRVIAGSFQGTVNFGGGGLTSAGGSDIFVAKYAATGAFQWAKRFGGANDDIAYGVAVDASGNVVIVGQFQGTVDFGGGALTSAGDRDIFVAKYSPTGTYLWARRYGSTGIDVAYGVAVDPSGNVLVTGTFTGTVDFGGTSLISGIGGLDSLVLKLSGATGATVWAEHFMCGGGDVGYGIGSDSSGNVIVVGAFAGHFFPNANDTVFNFMSAGASDVYVVKLSGSGAYLWAKQFSGSGADTPSAVAVDSNGDIALTGYFGSAGGTINFGCGALLLNGAADAFVAKVSGTNGACLWSKSIGGADNDFGFGVAIDPRTNCDGVGGRNCVVASGDFRFSANLGGGTVTASSAQDAYVVKYTSSGSYLWAKHFSNFATTVADNVSVDPSTGTVALTGAFQGTASFGVGTLTSAGANDIFLLTLAP